MSTTCLQFDGSHLQRPVGSGTHKRVPATQENKAHLACHRLQGCLMGSHILCTAKTAPLAQTAPLPQDDVAAKWPWYMHNMLQAPTTDFGGDHQLVTCLLAASQPTANDGRSCACSLGPGCLWLVKAHANKQPHWLTVAKQPSAWVHAKSCEVLAAASMCDTCGHVYVRACWHNHARARMFVSGRCG